jgi:hypothetical protein
MTIASVTNHVPDGNAKLLSSRATAGRNPFEFYQHIDPAATKEKMQVCRSVAAVLVD